MKGIIIMTSYIFNLNECQDLALMEIGNQKCTPLYSFGPYLRNEYIFHYIISGKGYCSYDQNTTADSSSRSVKSAANLSSEFEIKAGEGFLIEPHTKHVYHADQDDPWHYIWIIFKGSLVPRYLRACGISKNNAIYRPKDYTIQTTQRIKSHLNAILENPNKSKAYILGHLHLFFAELEANAAAPAGNKFHEDSAGNYYLSEAVRYINVNYPNIISLDEICSFCNISRSHMGRLFREYYHTSLQDYLIQIRLSKAKELLINTSLPVYEIANQVGYQNELNLLRAFKKKFGVSPNTFRKQNTL